MEEILAMTVASVKTMRIRTDQLDGRSNPTCGPIQNPKSEIQNPK